MSTWWETRSQRVSQAAAIVCVQAECSFGEALAMLKAHAELTDGDLEETALAVLVRRVRFAPSETATLPT